MRSSSAFNELSIVKGDINHFDSIYDRYKKDFPPNERKAYNSLKTFLDEGHYILLLLKHPLISDIMGYALVYDLSALGALWLDYIAIDSKYRGQGYGTFFLRQILNHYNPQIKGVFLEVEIPEAAEIVNRQTQRKRIHFYEKLKARRLDFSYLFPSPEGGFSMFLYFMTTLNLRLLSGFFVKQVLTSVFKGLHSDVTESKLILQHNIDSIGARNFRI